MSILRFASSATDPGVVAMLGVQPADLSCANRIAAEFNWTIRTGYGVPFVAAAGTGAKLAAVLFHRQALGVDSWIEALSDLKSVLPTTPLIVCHGFSDSIDWPRLCEAGAFHRVHLPLDSNELRQSFGFVWQAARRVNRASAA